jgi:hypothetical protein
VSVAGHWWGGFTKRGIIYLKAERGGGGDLEARPQDMLVNFACNCGTENNGGESRIK